MSFIYNLKVTGSPMKLVESEKALSINKLKAELGLEGSGYSVAVNGAIHSADLHDNDLSALSPYLVTFSPQVKGAGRPATKAPVAKHADKKVVAKKVVAKKVVAKKVVMKAPAKTVKKAVVAKGKYKPTTGKKTTKK